MTGFSEVSVSDAASARQDSGFHLFNGFSVESDGEDLRGWDVVRLDEVQDPCGYDCGFAATRVPR